MATIHSLAKSLEIIIKTQSTLQSLNQSSIERLMDRVDQAAHDRADNTWAQGLWNLFGGAAIGGLGIVANFIPGANNLSELVNKIGPMAIRTIESNFEGKKIAGEARQQAGGIHVNEQQALKAEMGQHLAKIIDAFSQITQHRTQACHAASS